MVYIGKYVYLLNTRRRSRFRGSNPLHSKKLHRQSDRCFIITALNYGCFTLTCSQPNGLLRAQCIISPKVAWLGLSIKGAKDKKNKNKFMLRQ